MTLKLESTVIKFKSVITILGFLTAVVISWSIVQIALKVRSLLRSCTNMHDLTGHLYDK